MSFIDNILYKKYTTKKISIFIVSFILIFGMIHTIVWFLYTKSILFPSENNKVGDLVRISCQTNSKHIRKNINTLKRTHLKASQWNGQQVDILTVGDSFSNGGGGGKNSFYQDYIETLYNKRVLNITPNVPNKHIETIISMYNNGMLDDIKPKVIILEVVERFIVYTLAKEIKWEYTIGKEQFIDNMSRSIYREKPNYISIINKRNYDCILNPIYYNFSELPLDRNKMVYRSNLNKNMFSVVNSNTLLFTKIEIDFIKNNSIKNLTMVNNNLNHLSKILKLKGIDLIFMPVVDKYDLYSSYIINNKFPINTFFKFFNNLNKQYMYINTKKILLPLIKKKKDVYFADDTHWSNIASQEVVSHIPISNILKNNKKNYE